MTDQIILSPTAHPAVLALASSSGACIDAAIDAAKAQAPVQRVESASLPANTYIIETGATEDIQTSYHRYNLFLAGGTPRAFIDTLANRLQAHFDAQDADCMVRVQH